MTMSSDETTGLDDWPGLSDLPRAHWDRDAVTAAAEALTKTYPEYVRCWYCGDVRDCRRDGMLHQRCRGCEPPIEAGQCAVCEVHGGPTWVLRHAPTHDGRPVRVCTICALRHLPEWMRVPPRRAMVRRARVGMR